MRIETAFDKWLKDNYSLQSFGDGIFIENSKTKLFLGREAAEEIEKLLSEQFLNDNRREVRGL